MFKKYTYTVKAVGIILLAIIFGSAGLWAEEKKQPADSACKKRIVAAPLIYYTPETRLAFGAAGGLIFRLGDCKNSTTRPSSISPLVIYTQEKQFKTLLKTELYFKKNKYRLETEIKMEKYPNRFYGIGNNTRDEDEEQYTSKSTEFFVSFLKNFGEGFYFGLEYHFSDWTIREVEAGGLLDQGDIPGSKGGTLSGIGVVANRDTRDNIYSPLKGDFFELSAKFYPRFLGSTYEYSAITLNLRKYVKLFSRHVLAFQYVGIVQSGEVPFWELAKLGGQYNMRGLYEGQFRDKSSVAMQVEYRVPLFWRIGFVGFGSLGKVAPSISQINFKDLKAGYGVGIRLMFDKKERIQVRFDYGFGGKGRSGFYASIFEAF